MKNSSKGLHALDLGSWEWIERGQGKAEDQPTGTIAAVCGQP